jgi:hypothetical protein
MKKLEKKQIPAVAALVLVTVGAVGYTVYSLLGVSKPAANSTTAEDPGGPAYGPGGTGPLDPVTGQPSATPNKQLAQLQGVPASFKTDPFNPAVVPPAPEDPSRRAEKLGRKLGEAFGRGMAELSKGLNSAFGSGNTNAPSLPPAGEWTPTALRDFATSEGLADETAGGPGPSVAAAPAPAPAPAPLVRPTLTLTGVIEGDNSVAILRGNQDERHFVSVNDRVAGRYVVKSISSDGVLLSASGPQPDRWFLPLGGEKK